jgi:Ca-activated chloride channel family protein
VVTVTVPTIFLSTDGGGLFFALEKAPGQAFLPEARPRADEAYADFSLSYTSASDGSKASDTLVVEQLAQRPSDGLRLGHTLIDEFLALREGATLYHAKSDEEGAYQVFRALAARLDGIDDPRLKPEREMLKPLVQQTALLSGHMGEAPAKMRPLLLQGSWEVTRVVDDQPDLKRGDRVTIDQDQMLIERGEKTILDSGFKVSRNQVAIESEGTLLSYWFDRKGREVTFLNRESGGQATLRRVNAAAEPR